MLGHTGLFRLLVRQIGCMSYSGSVWWMGMCKCSKLFADLAVEIAAGEVSFSTVRCNWS